MKADVFHSVETSPENGGRGSVCPCRSSVCSHLTHLVSQGLDDGKAKLGEWTPLAGRSLIRGTWGTCH